jgi:hypothetical protein
MRAAIALIAGKSESCAGRQCGLFMSLRRSVSVGRVYSAALTRAAKNIFSAI